MTTNPSPLSPRRWLAPLLTFAALLIGGAAGYDFGLQVSGALFGALTGVMGALLCSLLADAALQRLSARR